MQRYTILLGTLQIISIFALRTLLVNIDYGKDYCSKY